MPKLNVKDFKWSDFSHDLVVEETKSLVAHVNVPSQSVLFHVKVAGSNVIDVCKTLEEAVARFNELP